jgi:hypothetical protein
MAAFTTIAAATIAVGGQAAKGFLAKDAAADAARAAGRFRVQQEELEKQSVARLEANFYDAVRATTDVYDKQLQLANQQGSQILEAAQEGDQRGISATAGKVKQAQDATSGAIADKYAEQKLDIDMKRAEASEKDASEIAGLFDDRAAAAGVKADALTQQADDLSGQATGAFIDAGVSALSAGVTAFGGLGGMKNKMGQAADALSKKTGMDRAAALKQIEGLGLDRKGLNSIIDSGALPSVSTTTTTTKDVVDTTNTRQYDTFEDADSPAGVKTLSIGGGTFDMDAFMKSPEVQEIMRKKREEEEAAVSDFMKIDGMVDRTTNKITKIFTSIFDPEQATF